MYIQGFLLAVPGDSKAAYHELASKGWAMFNSLGATEMVEAWEDDVTDGKLTDFRKATQAKEGEKIVFSWIIWPDRATCDAASQKMQEDPAMGAMFGEPPFDGMRMMWGGFTPLLAEGR